MASTYVALIRSVQPDGPYALTGYSMGGLVAFEIAQRLRADGQQVDMLALLDTDLSPACLSRPARWWFAISRPFRYVAYAAAEPRERVPLFARKLLRRLSRWPLRSAPVPAPRPLSRFAELEQIGLLAYECYRPRRYDGRAILFVATIRYPGFCHPATAWPPYARELIIERIAGDHGSLVAEGTVAQLACRLSAWLRQGS
jgi:acetoacetyl-CoA synthetase